MGQNSEHCLTAQPEAMTAEEAVADWYDGRFRFREVVLLTGLDRGYIQGIEDRGLWKYATKNAGTGNWRSYSLADLLALRLARTLTLAGFEAAMAWGIIQGELKNIIVEVGMLHSRSEHSVIRNTIKITIPAAKLIADLWKDVKEHLGAMAEDDTVLMQNKALADFFDSHPEAKP